MLISSHRVRSLPPNSLISVAVCLLSLCLVGCGETEQITRYAVPKAESPSTDADDIPPLRSDDKAAPVWIYKLVGPAEAVAAQRDAFDALVESTVVSQDTADWTTPEGWTQQPGSGIRFATLRVDDSEPPLELSVTKLPLFGDRDTYLQQNINRWRGQVGLSPISGSDWLAEAKAAGEVEQPEVSGEGEEVTVVSLEGQTEEFGDSLMLAAIFLPKSIETEMKSPAAPLASQRPTSNSGSDQPLTYEAPEQWQPGKKSVMRVAAFQVTEGEAQVEITVIPAGGDLLSNVNRWRGQIGLKSWTDEELKQNSAEIIVGEAKADYVNLEGAEQTILAAVLPDGNRSWFFKLMGDPDLAKREEQRFKTFVESVRLKSE